MVKKMQRYNAVLNENPSPLDVDRADAILSAASQCFSRWGISRTRLDDVAKEVGIARPHIYRYFASKNAIVHAVVLREIRANHHRLKQRFPLKGKAADIIIGSLISSITDAVKDDNASYLLRGDSAHLTAQMLSSSPEIVEEVKKYWQPVLEYARKRGELREHIDIDSATRWLAFIEFSYLALPELKPDDAALKAQLNSFVVASLIERF